MSIGTSTFLSGLSYYALHYQGGIGLLFRGTALLHEASKHQHVGRSGVFVFIFLSLLTLWSTSGHLDLPWLLYIVLGVLQMGGPAIMVYNMVFEKINLSPAWYGAAIMCNALWVAMLCYLARETDAKNSFPYWSSARFVDVIGPCELPHWDEANWYMVVDASSETDSDANGGDKSSKAWVRPNESEWTQADSLRLEAYGGQRVDSPRRFEAQFQSERDSQPRSTPRKRFMELSSLVFSMWLLIMAYEMADEYSL